VRQFLFLAVTTAIFLTGGSATPKYPSLPEATYELCSASK
jgi:hypothetical protein